MSDSMGTVDFKVDGHIATLTLNRPDKLNTITKPMAIRLQELVAQINDDDNIRIVIFTGEGAKAFSAGSDIKLLDDYGSNWQLRNRTEYVRVLLETRKPIIAAIRGYAIGGGLELALAADIRIASETAKFGAGEIKLGWHGGGAVTQLLPRIVGPGMASLMIMTGDIIDAQEAHRVRLVEQVVPDDELETTVSGIAERIAANAPIAAQISKNLIRVAQSSALSIGLEYERDTFAYLMNTNDANEGIQAFTEKRPPDFKGE